MKRKLLPLLVSLILFAIPFFWFKPGEMDLGGDSSRLYFYDPISYLKNYSLFGISPSGLGAENIGYFSIPFVVILAVLKLVLKSPTILISTFHSFSLSVAFLSCYFVIKELAKEKDRMDRTVLELSALLGGLFYVFSPSSIFGWDKAIMTRNQAFLNPLMFYLLLRYFRTSRISYMIWLLFVTFLFSPNFSFAAAPGFFAFYPLSIVFLLIYTRMILQKAVVWKHVILGLAAFIGLQSFHLLPQIVSTFSPGSVLYATVFSAEGKFNRGLNYFTAIAPSVKASINLLALPQATPIGPMLWPMVTVPLVVILALKYIRKENSRVKKTILLSSVYFLITVFFATANITHVGLAFYKKLFVLPGFSIFRNYYGQWGSVFLFSYTLLFGQSLAVVLQNIRWNKVAATAIGLYFILTAWPFIDGRLVNKVLWQSKNMRIVMSMDPDYEQAISYMRSLPIDGKVLTLPLTDPGYQILAGKDDGAYEGPSIAAYIIGKKDFAGFTELGVFADIFEYAMKHDDYQSIQKILSLLDIRYIFYNADPRIYDETFPGFPYEYVRTFMPRNQAAYKQFLRNLDAAKLAQFGDRYFIYEIKEKNYLPHIYVPERIQYWNQPLTDGQSQLAFLNAGDRTALLNFPERPIDNSRTVTDIYLLLSKKSPHLEFLVKRRTSQFPSPYISRKLSWVFYPLVVLDEKRDLSGYRDKNDEFIDRRIFYAEKRINELEKWKDEISALEHIDSIKGLSDRWSEPQLFEVNRYKEYNSWEISFVRYFQSMIELINLIEGRNNSKYTSITNKVELKRVFASHEQKIRNSIKDSRKLTTGEKSYLLRLADKMFEDIAAALHLIIPNPSEVPYSLDHTVVTGAYEVYVKKRENTLSGATITIEEQKLHPKFTVDNDWLRFNDVTISQLSSQSAVLTVSDNSNLVKDTFWRAGETIETGTNSGSLVSIPQPIDRRVGLIRDILEWQAQSLYLVSFDYLTGGKNYRIKLYEQRERNESTFSQLVDDVIRSGEWKTYQEIVPSGEFAKSAFIQIVKESNDLLEELNDSTGAPRIDIKNLSVVEIPIPTIVLRKVEPTEQIDSKNPSITFSRINPTKYVIRIRGATAPYFLAFLEMFHPNWRLVNMGTVERSVPKLALTDLMNIGLVVRRIRIDASRLMEYMGTLAIRIVSPQEPPEEEIVVTHFGGDVSEASHRRVFVDTQAFYTWGKDSVIHQAKHFLVNGYANAWYIEPGDTGGKKDYDLVLEFATQKYFYIGVGISLFTLVCLLFYGWRRYYQ